LRHKNIVEIVIFLSRKSFSTRPSTKVCSKDFASIWTRKRFLSH